MVRNMGSADRWIRGIGGAAIVVWGLVVGSPWGWLGLIPLITAFVGTCPAYLPFGIRTGGGRKAS